MAGIDDQNAFEDEDRLAKNDLEETTTASADTDAEFTEEEIPEEEEGIATGTGGKPLRKKRAALKARHALEDYFATKKIKQELDYLEVENVEEKKEEPKEDKK